MKALIAMVALVVATGGAFAAEGSAVAVGRGDTHEPGDLLSIQLAEFRKLGDERGHRGRSQAGDRFDDSSIGLRRLISVDEFALFLFQRVELLFVEPDGSLDHATNFLVGGGGESVLFLGDQLRDLPPTRRQISQFLLRFREWFGGTRVYQPPKLRDDAGVDFVSLGELIHRTSEVPNLSGIHHGDNESLLVKHLNESPFESSGRFTTDERDLGFL